MKKYNNIITQAVLLFNSFWHNYKNEKQPPKIAEIVFRMVHPNGLPLGLTASAALAGGGVLVHPNGFEPSAPSVGGSCSIQLSYGCK